MHLLKQFLASGFLYLLCITTVNAYGAEQFIASHHSNAVINPLIDNNTHPLKTTHNQLIRLSAGDISELEIDLGLPPKAARFEQIPFINLDAPRTYSFFKSSHVNKANLSRAPPAIKSC